jgi:hypothetical protein
MQDKKASEAVLNMILSNIENLNLSTKGRPSNQIKYSQSKNFRGYMRKMPYAIVDGMVLNRGYNPLWAKDKGSISRKNYFKIIKHHHETIYFYDDSCSPWLDKKSFEKYSLILQSLIAYLDPNIDFEFQSLVKETEKYRFHEELAKERHVRSLLEIKPVSPDFLSDCWSDKNCWITIRQFAQKFNQFTEKQIRALKYSKKENIGIDRCFVVSKRRLYINYKVFSIYMSGTLPEQRKMRNKAIYEYIEHIEKTRKFII